MSSAVMQWRDRRAWGELAYCLVGFPLDIAGFVLLVTLLSLSAGLAVTFVGFPLLVVTLGCARSFGATYRGLARRLLGLDVPSPGPRPEGGITGRLRDRVAWRAVLFVLVRLPLGIVDFTVAVTVVAYGFLATTYWLWRPALPVQHVHGVAHRGLNSGDDYFLDTPGRILLVTVLGVGLLLVAPWVVRAVVSIDRRLVRGLLGPSAATLRVRQLQQSRSRVVEDSAAELRRIERDLHDGAQARLVALTMQLGLAREELAGDDPVVAVARARRLVDVAHREAKGTITDLRDLARGIHPPALDHGLGDALATLAARNPLPVSLHVAVEERPSPAVESIVYFATAELLTNITKHSGARHAWVSVIRDDHRMVLRVEDDGAGGAAVDGAGGSGLAGLADRVAGVDGRLDVTSPPGGPTIVTVEVPL